MSPHPAPSGSARNANLLVLGCIVTLAAIGFSLANLIAWGFRGADGSHPPWPAIVVIGLLALAVAWWRASDWWKRGGRGRIRRSLGLAPGVGALARHLGVPADRLRAFAPVYREARIAKRSGGQRVLHVPDDATKELQRKILHRVLGKLESHAAAFGFEAGRSIAHHAALHTGRAVVLHFDVVEFFPSTRAGRIERMFLRLGWNREAAKLLTKLTTHGGGLPQGAPTSPRLSNLVNRALDRDIERDVGRLRGRYSRYADDITVSFPEDWGSCVERTKARVGAALGRRGYEMHVRKKLSVRRRHQRQVVTGLVVNDKVALPRTLRRKLRAARHHLATGRPATWTEEQLRGWAAFEAMVRKQGAGTPPPWRRPRRASRHTAWRVRRRNERRPGAGES